MWRRAGVGCHLHGGPGQGEHVQRSKGSMASGMCSGVSLDMYLGVFLGMYLYILG